MGHKNAPHHGGPARIVPSPEEFHNRIDKYLSECDKKSIPVTYTGMLLGLGFTAKCQFTDYALKWPEYVDAVNRARMIVENAYELRLVLGTSSPAGSIFALKNFHWMDRHPTELDNLQAEKLKRELSIDQGGVAAAFAALIDKLPP